MNTIVNILKEYKEKGVRIFLTKSEDQLTVKGGANLSKSDKNKLVVNKKDIILFLQSQRQHNLKIPKTNKAPFYIKHYWTKAENFSHAINISFAIISREGKIEIDRLNRAFQKLCDKHIILKSFIRREKHEIYFEPLNFMNEIKVVNSLSYDDSIQECNNLHLTKFNFTEGPLVRGNLFNLKNGQQILFFSLPHLIFDGQSLEIFWDNLFELYSNENKSYEPLKMQFIEAGLYREMNSINGESTEYWKALKRDIKPIELFKKKNNAPSENKSLGSKFKIDSKLVKKLSAFCKAEKISMNSFFLILISLLVYNRSKEKLFTLCFDHHSRTIDTLHQIGGWVQHLYLQVNIKNYSLVEFVRYMSDNIINSMKHSNVDILKILKEKLGDDFESELRNFKRIRFNWYDETSIESIIGNDEFEHIHFDKGTYLPVYLHFFIKKSNGEIMVSTIGNNNSFQGHDLDQLQKSFIIILESLLSDEMDISKQIKYFLDV